MSINRFALDRRSVRTLLDLKRYALAAAREGGEMGSDLAVKQGEER